MTEITSWRTVGASYNSATGQGAVNSNNFSLSARFIVDTSKMTQASDQSTTPGVLSYFDNYNAGDSFISATAVKTGGAFALPVSSANARSYFYARDDEYGSYDYAQLYSGNNTSANSPYSYEFHANGSVSRQTYLAEDIYFYTYNYDDGGFDFGIIDGVQIVTGFDMAKLTWGSRDTSLSSCSTSLAT